MASAACSSTGSAPVNVNRATSAAPPLVVCGTVVTRSYAGPVVYDISRRQYPPVTELAVGGYVYIRVSDSCTEGADVEISPPSAFTISQGVKATDGRYELVRMSPSSHPDGVVTASVAGRVVGTLKLDIAKCC